jgi:hypothetical protein
MTIAGPGRHTYRQAKRSRVSAIRLVKETLAAQLSLFFDSGLSGYQACSSAFNFSGLLIGQFAHAQMSAALYYQDKILPLLERQ